jgi:hypothetical protein
MARYFYQQNSFQSGVLSPKLYSRTDVEEYRKALRSCDNFILLPTGGAHKRQGIRHYQSVETGTAGSGLGGQAIHIPIDITGVGTCFLRVEYGTGAGVIKAVAPNGLTSALYLNGFGINVALIDAARIDPYGFVYTQYGSYVIVVHNSGTMVPIIMTPTLTGGGAEDVQIFIQLLNTVPSTTFAASPQNSFYSLNTDAQIPRDEPNSSAVTLTLAAATIGTSQTLTSSLALFTDEMLGESILIDDKSVGGNFRVVTITATAGTLAVPSTTATVFINAGSATFSLTASNFWYEQSWSKRKGWPTTVTSFENRLIYAGNKMYPSTLWASRTGQPASINNRAQPQPSDPATLAYFRTFGATPDPSFPYSFTISLGVLDRINWLASMDSLFVGTNEKEIKLSGGDSAISVVNFPQVNVISREGSSNKMPSFSGSSIYFLKRNGYEICQIKYSSESGGNMTQVVSSVSDMLIHGTNQTKSVVIEKLVTDSIEGVNYLLTSDMKIYSFTSSSSSSFIGFTSVKIDSSLNIFDIHFSPSGSFDSTDDSLLVFYSYTGKNDKDFIGQIAGDPIYTTIDTSNLSINWCLDDFRVVENTVADELDLIPDFLTDKVVKVVTPEGEVLLITTPANPAVKIDLPKAYPTGSKFIVGLPYTARLETLPLEVGPNFLYSSRGDAFRIDTAHLELFRTYDLNYGSISDGEEILYPLEINTPPAFTGNIPVNIPMTSSNDTRIVVESDSPFNVTVLSLLLRGTNVQVN